MTTFYLVIGCHCSSAHLDRCWQYRSIERPTDYTVRTTIVLRPTDTYVLKFTLVVKLWALLRSHWSLLLS